MTFDAFVSAIQALAEADGDVLPGVPCREPDAWRAAFADGLTPDEAWDGESWMAREAAA